MDGESESLFKAQISKNSEAKMKEGILIGPQIKQLFEDHDFSTELNAAERRAWEALENVCRNFLGNERMELTVKLCRS